MTETEKAWTPVPENLGIYQIGDRVPWCDGCYGVITGKAGGWLFIRTDDGIDRLTGEDDMLRIEDSMAKAGLAWK